MDKNLVGSHTRYYTCRPNNHKWQRLNNNNDAEESSAGTSEDSKISPSFLKEEASDSEASLLSPTSDLLFVNKDVPVLPTTGKNVPEGTTKSVRLPSEPFQTLLTFEHVPTVEYTVEPKPDTVSQMPEQRLTEQQQTVKRDQTTPQKQSQKDEKLKNDDFNYDGTEKPDISVNGPEKILKQHIDDMKNNSSKIRHKTVQKIRKKSFFPKTPRFNRGSKSRKCCKSTSRVKKKCKTFSSTETSCVSSTRDIDWNELHRLIETLRRKSQCRKCSCYRRRPKEKPKVCSSTRSTSKLKTICRQIASILPKLSISSIPSKHEHQKWKCSERETESGPPSTVGFPPSKFVNEKAHHCNLPWGKHIRAKPASHNVPNMHNILAAPCQKDEVMTASRNNRYSKTGRHHHITETPWHCDKLENQQKRVQEEFLQTLPINQGNGCGCIQKEVIPALEPFEVQRKRLKNVIQRYDDDSACSRRDSQSSLPPSTFSRKLQRFEQLSSSSPSPRPHTLHKLEMYQDHPTMTSCPACCLAKRRNHLGVDNYSAFKSQAALGEFQDHILQNLQRQSRMTQPSFFGYNIKMPTQIPNNQRFNKENFLPSFSRFPENYSAMGLNLQGFANGQMDAAQRLELHQQRPKFNVHQNYEGFKEQNSHSYLPDVQDKFKKVSEILKSKYLQQLLQLENRLNDQPQVKRQLRSF